MNIMKCYVARSYTHRLYRHVNNAVSIHGLNWLQGTLSRDDIIFKRILTPSDSDK